MGHLHTCQFGEPKPGPALVLQYRAVGSSTHMILCLDLTHLWSCVCNWPFLVQVGYWGFQDQECAKFPSSTKNETAKKLLILSNLTVFLLIYEEGFKWELFLALMLPAKRPSVESACVPKAQTRAVARTRTTNWRCIFRWAKREPALPSPGNSECC